MEQCVASVNKTYYGLNLSMSDARLFPLLDLEKSAGDVAAAISNLAAELYGARLAQQPLAPAPQPERKDEPAPQPAASEPARQEADTGEQKTLTIIITYPASRSADVREAAMDLKRLCTSFCARKQG